MARVNVIIPAYNEALSIGKVVTAIPDYADEVIVVNNNSTDSTAKKASLAGATVLHEPRPGYGHACLKGIAYAAAKPAETRPDIIVFLDGDFSDYPQEMGLLLKPIVAGKADMVIGSRVLDKREAGSLLPQQLFGNWLATKLLHLLYGVKYTDLGPFRAIKLSSLLGLNMQDRTYGWTVEMQAKAAKLKVKSVEVPVSYRKRIGVSKVSGTIKGTVLAGYKIIFTILRYM
ncbi:glycosyltransferase family 2 protein [Pontibacter fetidus]|uniref:Glycosyltransferase family 2 protein n=1 Tax=Pontibacter fetidus TaxID=2700082 RepID=A0A6B2HAQ0_9BACT|nr:glycosyltransferase family 2 protein [Pontibacter fetidus]NDK56564.1 glycosyltransferase family 2 protein [Pontibacter fetidus]